MHAATGSPVRVRFAPSPTGHLHIGGLRTALFNWLFARHNGGSFLLRIEDTDMERSRAEYTSSILDSLSWALLESDEPIAIQSHFLARHQEVAHQLLASGKAYRCYCPKQEYVEGSYTKYPGTCRERIASSADENLPFAIRLKLPQSTDDVVFNDLIRGKVVFTRDQLDDFIIIRSDGVPIYNFVVVVDDIAMKISHVIRGEEHVSNTPRQLMIYQALGVKPPTFAHLPMILGPTGAKLSKRDGTTSVSEYAAQGYLPEALCNYLVRLGWAHGDQEIFNRKEMVSYFSLEAVGSKGAIFDKNKLDWVNGTYIRSSSTVNLIHHITRYVDEDFFQKLPHWSAETVADTVALYKDRVKTLRELIEELIQLHNGPRAQSIAIQGFNESTYAMMHQISESLAPLDNWQQGSLQEIIKGIAQKQEVKLSILAQPLRLALTGKSATPGIFDILVTLGKEESLRRLNSFLEHQK